MTMLFQSKPSIEGHYCFEVYGDSGELLATSDFFRSGGHRLAATTCIIQDKPTVQIRQDETGRWYFEIFAGEGSPKVPKDARLMTSKRRYPTFEQVDAAVRSFMEEAKRKGPGGPVVVM